MELDPIEIKTRLQRLQTACRKKHRFRPQQRNAWKKYRLNSPVGEEETAALETRLRFTFPEEYRRFVIKLGDGGAGPGCGLFPLGLCHDRRELVGFERQIGNLEKPFRFSERWNATEELWREMPDEDTIESIEEVDAANRIWEKRLEAEYWDQSLLDGAIPIADLGCAIQDVLVVTGSQRGQVWRDRRSEYEGIEPLVRDDQPVSFSTWYLQWLEKEEKEYGI